jgi:hypothetical protein
MGEECGVEEKFGLLLALEVMDAGGPQISSCQNCFRIIVT